MPVESVLKMSRLSDKVLFCNGLFAKCHCSLNGLMKVMVAIFLIKEEFIPANKTFYIKFYINCLTFNFFLVHLWIYLSYLQLLFFIWNLKMICGPIKSSTHGSNTPGTRNHTVLYCTLLFTEPRYNWAVRCVIGQVSCSTWIVWDGLNLNSNFQAFIFSTESLLPTSTGGSFFSPMIRKKSCPSTLAQVFVQISRHTPEPLFWAILCILGQKKMF